MEKLAMRSARAETTWTDAFRRVRNRIALVAAAICAATAPLSSQADTGPLNGTPDDVRVAPLLTAHWNQGDAGGQRCYNYYTPLNRVCGCTATSLSQIMYYHKYPTERILPGETLYDSIDGYGSYSVSTNGNGGMTNTTTGEYTAFDPPYGGPYDWNSMVDSPTGSTPENSRKAIGLLTRDAGFAVFSHYFGGSTSGYTDAVASSIILNLHYADAVKTGFNTEKLIANLDAGLPVEVGITAHSVVADGYGYHNGKLYIHINYGYGGNKDGWYDPTTDINGKSFQNMVANIFPPTRGARHSSVISGRVLDASGNPVANATVTATGATTATTNSNANGTYAFILPADDYTFAVSKSGAVGSRAYTVAASSQKTRAEGNGWGNGVNNSASGVDVTVYTESDFAKTWRNNAGDGRFDNPQNWSGGTLPASGEDVAVFVSGDTVISSETAMTVGTVSVPSGTVRFSGSGAVITLGGLNLLSAASAVEITGREGLPDGGITGVGTLVINPGAGNTYTMTKNNGANAVPYDAAYFWGETVIASGTVKCGNIWSFGSRRDNNDNRQVPTVRVKGGATLDENGLSTGDYGGETLRVILEEGATLKSTGNSSSGLTSIILEGNATVDTSSGKVVACYGYDCGSSPVSVNLGTNTLTKVGSGQFYLAACRFSGTGTLDVQQGEVRVKIDAWNYFSTSTLADGTLRIRPGATFTLEKRGDNPTHFTVKDLILDGTIARTASDCVFTVTGTVTGSTTGSGTTPMLTLGSDAVFKPTGTGYLTVTESLSGTFRLDMSGVDLSSTNEVPLVSVPSALAESVRFDSTTIPAGWSAQPVPENGNVRYVLTDDDHFTEREMFHTDLLGRFAKRAEDFDVGDYVQTGLIAHYDGIRNAGADLPHDPTTRTWKNLVSGAPDATFVGEGGEWNAAGNGFVFDGSSVRADMDSPGIDMNHVNSTVQIACDVDYTQQSNGGGWYPGIFVMTDQDYGIFYNNTGSKSNVLNYKPWPYSNNDGGQRPTINPWGGKYVTAAFDGYKQYLVEGTSLGEGKPRTSYSDQAAKRFAWGGNPQGSTRYVKGTYHSVRIYNATLTEEQLAQNRYVDEMRFRGAFMADDVDIVIATSENGLEGVEPCGEYMVNGSYTFSATNLIVNGYERIPAGYTLEKWNADSGTWTHFADCVGSSFAYTNCLANGKMRLTWDFAVVVATPSSPTPTQFSMGQQTAVTLTCATEGATIYYTTDGSDPTTSSTAYSAPFAVTSGTTVKAMAYMDGAQQSGIYTATFTSMASATLTHRWSFNGTTDVECLADSVGNATATKSGSSVTWNDGKAVVASTGSGTNKGYLDLGAGVLGSGDATLEIWYEKLENPGAWSSAFAYGRNGDNRFQINTAYGYNQEYGGSTGSSRAPVTAKIGGTDRISSTDWSKGCLASLVPNLPQHISITFKRNGDGSTTVRWMSRDSVTGFLMKECSGTIPSWTLADASDFVLTLGRDTGSTYDLKANFHEVRTWNGVLSDEQLSANAFAGPDALLGGRESAFSSGFDIAAGSTFTIGKEGMFRTFGPVGVGTGASIVFDTANFSGTEMKFVSAGFSLPAGASSVLDFVTLTDSDNYVASVDGGTITVVSAQPAYAKWIGASAPTSAADLANAANWTCYGQDGTTVISGAVPGSLTTLLIDGTTSFSLPAGVTPTWGAVLVGGHAATCYGRIASTGGDNNWITFRQRPITDYTPCGKKAVSYLDRTSGNSPSDLGGSQLRFDGWIYVSAEQAGRWDIRCAMDDMITFALDGEWQFLLNTWHYGITAGSYVSEGWHRFTLIVRDTGGGYGVSTALNGKNYPFVVSINGGAELGFSQLTFGADTAVTLADDCDWSALGEINLANGVVIDLNGHTLKLDDFTTDSFGAMVTNKTGTMSTMIFDKDPFSSSANVQGLLRGVGENITLVQDGARSATWTGGGNDGGDPANPANWEVKLGTLVIANAVPDYNTTVLMQGQNINMQLPYGTTLNCADFQIGNCTFTADCDWRGLSITPSISGEANLNGHNLYLGHLNAVGGSFVNNAADTTSRVLFDVPASGSYSEFSEQLFIDNIGNLSTGENVFLSLLKPDDENDTTTATLMLLGKSANVTAEFVQTNGTVNLGDSVNKFGNSSGHRGVYAMYGGTLTTGGGSEFVIGANGNGTFNLSGGDVTIGNWISVGRFSGGNGTFNMTGGSLTVSRTNRPMWLGGDNGTGVFNFGGTATATFKGIDIGRMKSARGTLNMNGGTLTVSNGDGFNVGRDAVGIVEQNDGTLNVSTPMPIGATDVPEPSFRTAAR